jgi:hypothetical protein
MIGQCAVFLNGNDPQKINPNGYAGVAGRGIYLSEITAKIIWLQGPRPRRQIG